MTETYYRIKMTFPVIGESGKPTKVKADDIVAAVNYTDAEKVAMLLIRNQGRDENGDVEYEIVKTKIDELFPSNLLIVDHDTVFVGRAYAGFDDSEGCTDGLYQVKLRHEEGLNDKGERTFKTETVWVIAKSSDHAKEIAETRFDGLGCIIREIKYDPAESIIVPKEFFEKDAEN